MDGIINEAHQKTLPAAATLLDADNAFKAAYRGAYGGAKFAIVGDMSVEALISTTENLVPSLNQVKLDYLNAKTAHDALAKARADLMAELVKLDADLVVVGPRPDTDIIGGTSVQEQNAIVDANVTIEAQAQVNKIGQFRKELSTLVEADKKKERSAALHAIIG
jgi:hypothetical protein